MTNPNYDTFHVIKDPVHGTMQFTTKEDRWIKPFIDSPHFQRLRHIKQLGMGDFIFPGAVHTRFNHSLGCCYVGSQIAKKMGLQTEERQLVMIACLLHDIGHGPFSHAFEDVFYDKQIRHEAWTPFFLADYSTPDFFKAYQLRNQDHPLTQEKFALIESMIMHKSDARQILADIVSSQLDADRLDYLLRDSHFCGVTYGEFDFRWMINSMTIVTSPKGERLGLTYKGIGVVEHYLMARRLMTRNIYHHPKKLALEFFLVQLLCSLAAHLKNYAPFAEIKTTRLGQFLLAANSFNEAAETTKNLEPLKEKFLRENYAAYKELCDYDVFAIIHRLAHMNDKHPAIEIAKRLHYRQMPKIIRLEHHDTKAIETLIEEFRKTHASFEPWQLVLIKTPHQAYSGEDDPILIADEQLNAEPLNDMSFIIHAISDKPEHTAFLCIDREKMHDKPVMQFIHKLAQYSNKISV
ncbi:MAG: hypothetical protein ACD_60C00025G0084 [uncultured bacterium]|nr:MAG: hypothetical protein ACD_60C00025G0084 [uncultured bacterium]